MPVLEVSGAISKLYANNSNPYRRTSLMSVLIDWLNENVGGYYGKGDDNVIAVGSGWELFVLYNGKPKSPDNEDSVVTYHLDITDEAMASMFVLKWL